MPDIDIKHSGQRTIATLNGVIKLEEGRGRLAIYDPDTNNELVVLDRSGFLFSDGDTRRIKLGSYMGRVGLWMSKPGLDVITLLGG